MQRFSPIVNKSTPLITISPIHFKMLERNVEDTSALDFQEQDIYRRYGEMSSADHPPVDDIITLSCQFNSITATGNRESSSKLKQERSFIRSWLVGQLKEISSQMSKLDNNSMLLPSETLLHFQIIEQTRGSPVDLIYLLTIVSGNFGAKHNNFELVLETKDGIDNLELALQQLELSKAISLDSTKERTRKFFGTSLSSLRWLEFEISDITKSNSF